jgi:peptidyl-prolyl cis-trans isomerase SurA
MKKNNFLIRGLISLIIVCGAFTFSRAEEKIVAIVNKEAITQRDLESFLNFMKVQLSQQFTAAEIDEKIEMMKADLLDRLIEDRLILQEAKKNKLEADEARVKAKIDELKKHYSSEAEFEDSLKKQGLVEADLLARVRDQILMYNIVEIKIRDKILIKPSEITEFYSSHPGEFALNEERQFESLEGFDLDKALKVAEDLRQGKDLKEVIKESGFIPNVFTASQGGELRKELEDVLFGLKPGEVSEPIQITSSFYVFQLLKIIPAHRQPISRVQNAIHELLYEKKMQEAMVKWVDELKKKAYIQKL